MARTSGRRSRDRGEIERLPSRSLRVKVYAGTDKVSGKRLYLTETVPVGPRQARLAEEVRTKLLSQVDEQRNPKTRATLSQLVRRHFEVSDVATSTLREYKRKYYRHIEPYLGKEPLAKLQNAEPFDSLYAELRRCSKQCKRSRGRNLIDHRTDKPGHACDEHRDEPCAPARPDTCRACRRACKPHVCVPLADNSILAIHWILSGALDRGVKWNWIAKNPVEQADKPSMPKPDPRPPTAAEAAQLINGAYAIDDDWGEFIFSKATTGNRRSEHCALQWRHFEDPPPPGDRDQEAEPAVLVVRQALYKADDGTLRLKDTKTHQQRRTVLDHETRLMLRARYERKKAQATALGLKLRPDAYIFSPDPDGIAPLKPDTATQKFGRMAKRLGVQAELKNWRHYHATELIAAGLDINVVAARLGHGGGGSTTLRSYTAYQAERSQRAAEALIVRMPPRPASRGDGTGGGLAQVVPLPSPDEADLEPYRQIAADLRGAITSGFVAPGDPLPTMKSLAERYGVALSTAHRAVSVLVEAGLVNASRGVRATVADGEPTNGRANTDVVG